MKNAQLYTRVTTLHQKKYAFTLVVLRGPAQLAQVGRDTAASLGQRHTSTKPKREANKKVRPRAPRKPACRARASLQSKPVQHNVTRVRHPAIAKTIEKPRVHFVIHVRHWRGIYLNGTKVCFEKDASLHRTFSTHLQYAPSSFMLVMKSSYESASSAASFETGATSPPLVGGAVARVGAAILERHPAPSNEAPTDT